MAILLRGLKGEPVKRLQTKLGVEADGVYGADTEKAVKDFQKSESLQVDGIAGPDTFVALGLAELILLKRGSKGAAVKQLQEKLGIEADGKYGPATVKAVKEYQSKTDLKADGIAGPATLAQLTLFGVTDGAVIASQVEPPKAPDPKSEEPRSKTESSKPAPQPHSADAARADAKSIWDNVTEATEGALKRVKDIFGKD